ncbi:MAG: PorT family protein [Prevotellaceae bacterium]|nr:PorT family protein [Prevotellaceae bacterium]
MKTWKYLLWIAGLLTSVHATAQSNNEVSIYAGGGVSTLLYSSSALQSSYEPGGHIGIGYTFFFTTEWGIGTGAELTLLNAGASFPLLSDAYNANDGSDPFIFHYTVYDYSEKIQMYSANIPLMIYYRSPVNPSMTFYAGLGGKVSIPLQNTVTATMPKATTAGYYSAYHVDLHMPAFRGFGTFENLTLDGAPTFKMYYIASAETGLKWRISSNWSIYTGLYVDYGLTSIVDGEQDKPFIPYNETAWNVNPVSYHHSALVSSYARNTPMVDKFISDNFETETEITIGNQQPLAGNVTTLAAGLKIKVIFGQSGEKKHCLPCLRYELDQRGTKKK